MTQTASKTKKSTKTTKAAKKPPANGAATKTPEALLQVVALLEHEDGARRRAAAIVLGELADGRDAVLVGLRGALKRTDDVKLRVRATEALGEIAPKSIVKDLRPLIKDPDASVREMVREVLARGKGIEADDIAQMLEARDEKQRLGAIAVLGARGGPKERQRLLEQLNGKQAKIRDAVMDALLPLLPDLPEAEADEMLADIEALMTPTHLDEDPKLAACLIELAGAMPHEDSARLLLRVAQSRASDEVRARAIEALRLTARPKRIDQQIYRFGLDTIESRDAAPKIVSTTIDTLTGVDMPLSLEPRVRALIDAESAPVRRWALRALGALDSAPAGRALAQAALQGDATDREIAIETALGTHNGRAALAKALVSTTEPERAQKIASGLRKHSEGLQPSTLHILERGVFDAEPEISGLIIELLKHCGGQIAQRVKKTLLERAMEMKQERLWPEAAELFKRLAQDPEARFQQAVCELKMSKRVLSRGPKNDACLLTFGTLLKSRDFPIIQRITKEVTLGPDELYYLGFSLAEASGVEHNLGGDILTALSEGDDEKLARKAHNKLVTMGWIE